MARFRWSNMSFSVILLICQTALIILYGLFVDYGWDATPISLRGRHGPVDAPTGLVTDTVDTPLIPTNSQFKDAQDLTQSKVTIERYYGMFQDVHVMIFIGFGFLMTFMRKYGYGGVGYNYIMAALVIQWAILLRGFFEFQHNDYRIPLDITKLIGAEFSAGTILITLGVVLGKLSPSQYIIMIVIETALAMVNEWLSFKLYQVNDIGGTITIHLFGAFFGLALARTIHVKDWSRADFNNLKYGTHYNDLFSMVGTMFLFMFWPSFNAVLANGDGRYRALLNTYLSISASCVGAYLVSWSVKQEKFSMDIVQNATLAGGVVVGAVCDLFLYPWGALTCGFLAGIISALGFHYLSPFLDQKWGVHDTCGVNNLHAMPALLGSFISAIVTGCATPAVYGSSFYDVFPAAAPLAGSDEYVQLKRFLPSLNPGSGRTAIGQAANQLAALITTLGISIFGGIITGAILSLPIWQPLNTGSVFDDDEHWITPKKMTPLDEGTLRSDLSLRRMVKRPSFPLPWPLESRRGSVGPDFVVRARSTAMTQPAWPRPLESRRGSVGPDFEGEITPPKWPRPLESRRGSISPGDAVVRTPSSWTRPLESRRGSVGPDSLVRSSTMTSTASTSTYSQTNGHNDNKYFEAIGAAEDYKDNVSL